MSIATEITKAIGVHGMWKQHLREAIDARQSAFKVEQVRADNQCEFGQWLYTLPAADKASARWQTVHDLHAQFHTEAARILALALNGHKQSAEQGLALGSEFAKISAKLTTAMMQWRDSAN